MKHQKRNNIQRVQENYTRRNLTNGDRQTSLLLCNGWLMRDRRRYLVRVAAVVKHTTDLHRTINQYLLLFIQTISQLIRILVQNHYFSVCQPVGNLFKSPYQVVPVFSARGSQFGNHNVCNLLIVLSRSGHMGAGSIRSYRYFFFSTAAASTMAQSFS